MGKLNLSCRENEADVDVHVMGVGGADERKPCRRPSLDRLGIAASTGARGLKGEAQVGVLVEETMWRPCGRAAALEAAGIGQRGGGVGVTAELGANERSF